MPSSIESAVCPSYDRQMVRQLPCPMTYASCILSRRPVTMMLVLRLVSSAHIASMVLSLSWHLFSCHALPVVTSCDCFITLFVVCAFVPKHGVVLACSSSSTLAPTHGVASPSFFANIGANTRRYCCCCNLVVNSDGIQSCFCLFLISLGSKVRICCQVSVFFPFS